MASRVLFVPALVLAASACAQTVVPKAIEPSGPARPPNSEKTYRALREDLPAADGVEVKDLTLEREGGVFHFNQGEFYFYAPVEGRVTGAVFVGKGRFELTPKDPGEKRSLALLTKGPTMSQDFSSLVLRFTDGTADEVRKTSAGAAPAPDGHVAGDAEDLERAFRKELEENLELRLLEDVVGGQKAGAFFLASFRMGNALSGRNVLFIVDPDGTFHAAPDEVELTTWSDVELQPWVAYRMQHVDEKQRGLRVQVTDERLDVTLDHSGDEGDGGDDGEDEARWRTRGAAQSLSDAAGFRCL